MIKRLLLFMMLALLTACGQQAIEQEQATRQALGGQQDPAALVPSPVVPADVPEEFGQELSEEDLTTADSGLQYVIYEEGEGPPAEPGDVVSVHYVGTLEDGTEFDSSYSRGQPFQFVLGQGQVIPAWDEGIALLNEGGTASLIAPPELAYGSQGRPPVIPPDSTLRFDVRVVDVQSQPEQE